MVTLFVLGVLVFALKLVHIAVKAAWSITKWVLFVIGLPVLLAVLFAAGCTALSVIILLIALTAAFIRPVFRGV